MLELGFDEGKQCEEAFAVGAEVAMPGPGRTAEVKLPGINIDGERDVIFESEDPSGEDSIDTILGSLGHLGTWSLAEHGPDRVQNCSRRPREVDRFHVVLAVSGLGLARNTVWRRGARI